MKTFTGRVVSPGCVSAEAVVSHGGLNTPCIVSESFAVW